jgi:glutaminyl-tRNA synthetase
MILWKSPQKNFSDSHPGNEVRLRYAYIIKCEEVIKDSNGNVTELRCTYDHETRSGTGSSNKKVKGTIHWVSAKHAVDAEVRLYDRLFNHPDPDGEKEVDFKTHLNPDSLKVLKNCKCEPFLDNVNRGDRFQFERNGYFCVDIKDSEKNKRVFNRTVTLKDTWAKIQKSESK